MDLGGTSDPPGGVKEGSDEVGAMDTFDLGVKSYNTSKN